jgi:glycine dehydrogenase subunit 1
MKYTQLTDADVAHMLGAIGVKRIEDLFSPIPEAHRCRAPLGVPAGLSELEMLRDAGRLAARNRSCAELTCFLGGGAYDHFIPTLVDALAHQSEFLTAYTPYQAEASQGILQLYYEFQTMICALTGMDVANASLYEGASAAAEAVTMAMVGTRRTKVAVADNVHPDTVTVLKTYGWERDMETVVIPTTNGVLDSNALAKLIDDTFAAVVVQSPNFFGCVERLDRIIPAIKQVGAYAIVSADPIASGLLKPPGDFGADIVVGEGQPLGIPLQYGAPYLGLLATREAHLRKMPGRVVGVARDQAGRRGFCLVLQTREQHIKRERATSNVCTNQGLMATRAAVYMALMGRRGIAEAASQCFDKAHYAASRIAALDGYSLRFAAPFFKEFTVRTRHEVQRVIDSCRAKGILAGVPLGRFDERFADCFLVAVTEKRTRAEIDALVAALSEV